MTESKTITTEIPIDILLQSVEDFREKFSKGLAPVNIVIAGKTGAGKSSLINAVFGEDVAEVGHIDPTTQTAKWHKSDRIPLSILDTKGLEVKDYQETLRGLKSGVGNARGAATVADQPHIAWLCVQETGARFEEAEYDVIEMLNELKIPVIVVITKHGHGSPRFVANVREKIAGRVGLRATAIVPVNAMQEHPAIPVCGLAELIDATYAALPEGVRAAFAAAQRVSISVKRRAAEISVDVAAGSAAAIALAPVPFSDAIAIVPIQVGMIMEISRVFGVNMGTDMVIPIVTAVAGSLGLAVIGRAVVGAALKFVPGVGSILGGAISSATAAGLTRAFGRSYIEFLCSFHEMHGRHPSIAELTDLFPTFWSEHKSVQRDVEMA